VKAVVIPVTPFVQNCTLLWCERTMGGAVVDPGGDLDRVRGALAEHAVALEKVLITHGHMDHAGGAAELAEGCAVPIEGPHRDDKFLLDDLEGQGRRFGLMGARAFEPDRWLEGGDTVSFGDELLEVRHCPGHTPGHVIFFHPGHKLALVGDVLFKGSIGRTDFPRGDHATLIRSIRTQLWPLGDDVTFVSGHGALSTFGDERRTNPFCADFVQV